MTIWVSGSFSSLRANSSPLVTYLIFGFAFFVGLAGVALLFKEIKIDTPGMAGTSMSEVSDLEMAVAQLGKNYDILRQQATQGFVLAAIFMALGVLVILTGAVGDMFGFKKEASNLTTVAGVVVETISGLGMYLFNRTFKQLNVTSDRLHEFWRLLAAFKRAEGLPEEHRAEMVCKLIDRLVQGSDLPPKNGGSIGKLPA